MGDFGWNKAIQHMYCAPAQEEKEMDRDGVHTGGIKPDEPMGLPPSMGARIVTGLLPRPEEAAEKRTADLRQLHRDAALAVLAGMPRVGMESNITIGALVAEALLYADEFVRQYNPDAVIAEVVG